MTDDRRAFIKKSVAIGGYSIIATGGLLTSSEVNAEWLTETTSTDILQQTLKRLFKDQEIIESDKIDIQIPKTAENGAAVPITVSSSLNHVESIAILVEKNPIPLAAKFELSPDLEPVVSARLKIAESSAVAVIVETNEGFFTASEKVIVTPGGCEI
ncbi:thiosulfate-binding protein SoxY [Methylobacter tundripaludum]|uniref:Thiosulfate-binding protein SoxY n=1 Tax=Methylobacter tundripaludum TaxID=173365 RepID=A0A2S6HBL7_9GAMM|nr:thiosulfate oxidation carrier protein SoxY [Methylobacter tundripaludum]PPK74884.1 thiosulfate-binding protein SoxY [Methylobacter tundripaludum]